MTLLHDISKITKRRSIGSLPATLAPPLLPFIRKGESAPPLADRDRDAILSSGGRLVSEIQHPRRERPFSPQDLSHLVLAELPPLSHSYHPPAQFCLLNGGVCRMQKDPPSASDGSNGENLNWLTASASDNYRPGLKTEAEPLLLPPLAAQEVSATASSDSRHGCLSWSTSPVTNTCNLLAFHSSYPAADTACLRVGDVNGMMTTTTMTAATAAMSRSRSTTSMSMSMDTTGNDVGSTSSNLNVALQPPLPSVFVISSPPKSDEISNQDETNEDGNSIENGNGNDNDIIPHQKRARCDSDQLGDEDDLKKRPHRRSSTLAAFPAALTPPRSPAPDEPTNPNQTSGFPTEASDFEGKNVDVDSSSSRSETRQKSSNVSQNDAFLMDVDDDDGNKRIGQYQTSSLATERNLGGMSRVETSVQKAASSRARSESMPAIRMMHRSSAELRAKWRAIEKKAAQLGKGSCKEGALILRKEHWLEACDKKHRCGSSLRAYYEHWLSQPTLMSFFDWLDCGDGRAVDLAEPHSRASLETKIVKYCNEDERRTLETWVNADGLLTYKRSQRLIHTLGGESEGVEGELWGGKSADDLCDARDRNKWIYVIDTNGRFFIGKKVTGRFHHSSFLAGGAIIAAGALVIDHGRLLSVNPSSGHYHPDSRGFEQVLTWLRSHGVDMTGVEIINRYKKPKGLGVAS